MENKSTSIVLTSNRVDVSEIFKQSNDTKVSFICKSKELKTQLKKIIGVIGKSYMPICETFKINVLDGRVTFQATNLNTFAKVTIDCETIRTGKICIDAKQLMNFLNVIQDCNVLVSFDLTTLEFYIGRNGGNLAKWTAFDSSEFPVWKTAKVKRDIIEISAPFLINGIEKTINYCANDESRPVMNGINLEVGKENIKFVSTDAHKLAVNILHKRERNYKTYGFDQTSFIIPKEAAKIVLSAIKNESSIVELALFKTLNIKRSKKTGKDIIFYTKEFTHLSISFNGVKFLIHLTEGKYPNYNAVIPMDNDKILLANRKELINAVKTVSLSANKSTNQIRFALNGICQISAEDIDLGHEQKEYVKDFVFSQNEIFEIGFNGKFVLELLKGMDCEQVKIEMSSPTRAALFIPMELNRNEQFLSLICPIQTLS